MNKVINFLCVIIVLAISNQAYALPTFYSGLVIDSIETWPNAPAAQHGYTVYLTSNIPNTGCTNGNIFSVEPGDFHQATLSILLAAMAANKKIKVRVARCSDRPVVDRVSITSD